MHRWTLLAAVMLALAGCGGDGSGSSTSAGSSIGRPSSEATPSPSSEATPSSSSPVTSSEPAPPPPGSQNYATMAELHAAVTGTGVVCEALTEDGAPAPARARGRCTTPTGELVLYLWPDTRARVMGMSPVRTGLLQGGSGYCFVMGTGFETQGAWSIDGSAVDRATCDRLSTALPGEMEQFTPPPPTMNQLRSKVGTPCPRPGEVLAPIGSDSSPSYSGPPVGQRGVVCVNGAWSIIADSSAANPAVGCGDSDRYPYATPDGQQLLCVEGNLFVNGETRQTINAGTYRVGNETGYVAPGTYAATDVDGCYWERLDAAGEIIDNNFVNAAPRVEFTVRASDYAINIQGCGGFTRV